MSRYIVLSMLLSGAFAGLAGAIQVYGLHHRMFTDGSATGFTGSAGFNGIVVALFGHLHPLGSIPASILFGALIVGANKLQRVMQVPTAFITALNGLVVIFVVSSEYWRRRWARRRETEPIEKTPGATEAEVADMISDLFTTTVLVGILASGFRLATPYLYAALGETFGQKSGVLNLGVEGIMLLGAFAGFYVSFTTNNLWLGTVCRNAGRCSDGIDRSRHQCHIKSRTRHQRDRSLPVWSGNE